MPGWQSRSTWNDLYTLISGQIIQHLYPADCCVKVFWKRKEYQTHLRRLISPRTGMSTLTLPYKSSDDAYLKFTFPPLPSLFPKVIFFFFLFMKHFKVDSHSTPHAHWGMKLKILIHIWAPSIGATLGFVRRVLPGEFLTQKKRLLHAARPRTQADRDKGREAVME